MVPLMFHDQFEELETWYPLPPAPLTPASFAPMHCVSTFMQRCKLSIIMNKILNKIYREKSEILGPHATMRNLKQLNEELDEWLSSLPLHLRLPPTSIGRDPSNLPPPTVYVLLIMFNTLKILLHRPFVSYGHLQTVLPDVAKDSFSACATSATCIAQYLESYDKVHSLKLAPFFLFYSTFVASTIHVRIAAQHQFENEAFAYLRICLSVYEINVETNPAVKKAKAVVQRLMDRMGVKLPEQAASPSMGQNSKTKSTQPALPRAAKRTVGTTQMPLPDFDALQGWDLSNVDFDSILQSFSKPLREDDIRQSIELQFVDQRPNIWPTSTLDLQGTSMANNFHIQNQILNGATEDGLFGFDVSSPEDRW